MKIVKLNDPQHECYRCNKKLHLVYYGNGGDFAQCPVCHFPNDFDDYKWGLSDDNDILPCLSCGVLFNEGDTHASNGCTEDTYHALFPGKFDYDGTTYVNQVPIVKTKEDFEKISNIVWVYYDKTIKGYDCPKAYYPREPQPLKEQDLLHTNK